MKEYYFLVAYLPQLEIGHLPALGMDQLKELLLVNLSSEDLAKVRRLLRMIDVENFRAFWMGEPLEPRGNLSRDKMERAFHEGAWSDSEPFPDYMIAYLDKYQDEAARTAHFSQLLVDYFAYEVASQEGFLKEYFTFLRELQLVLLGFRAKKLHRDIVNELQFEDAGDPIVAQILAQKDAPLYEPPFEYKELRLVFENHGQNPLELHKALYAYQFSEIIDRWGEELFTIDRILNYIARLILVERWQELNVQKGIAVIDKIQEGVK